MVSSKHNCSGIAPGRWLAIVCATLISTPAFARGVSPYLPLNMAADIERQIERVMILADQPVMTRPIAAAAVLDALPKACAADPALCAQVRRYLQRYMRNAGITQASAELAVTANGETKSMPSQRGMLMDSAWQAAASAFWQPSDFALASVGGVAYDGRAVPSGSMLSFGFARAQVDVGYRDHWLSPFTDSSLLISTQAPTMPSITLSNYVPFKLLGFQYQVFLAQMAHSDNIAYQGRLTSGNPRLAGLHLQIQPVSGYALSVNRVMQYGGGERSGSGFNDLLKALYKPSRYDNTNAAVNTDQEFGNQAAAVTSRMIFPGARPFSVYFEYAGEDNSYAGNFRLGNSALSMGLDLPRVGDRFDFTYEASEWQNAWYVHHIYRDGLANHGHVIGHWFGDERQRGDGVGGMSHMLRLGWHAWNGYLQFKYRTLANQNYSGVDYVREHEIGASYARPWKGNSIGAELAVGRDVFDEHYARLAASFSFDQDWWSAAAGALPTGTGDADAVDVFVDLGGNVSRANTFLGDVDQFFGNTRNQAAWTESDARLESHIGFGARRKVSRRSDLGARIELDNVAGHSLLSVRAVDYRYRLTKRYALNGFLGAGRYNLATPAYGYYIGLGLQVRDVLPKWDISLDARHHEKVARDKLLPSDPPQTPRNDMFVDINGFTLYASRRF